jgi:threonine aldolase
MLQYGLHSDVGDDVMNEDPTIQQLQAYTADLFGKERGLYVPTGTMANLCAIIAHCYADAASEIIIGSKSHINLWEGGNVSSIGGIYARQVSEDEHGQLSKQDVVDSIRHGYDDHWPISKLICIENSHNMCGGIALSKQYVDSISDIAHSNNLKIHMDGARIFNAAVAQQTPVAELCQSVDSISICLSKGLGAPLGSVLVGSSEFITIAKRARKRCGGGMRQGGYVAGMGYYAIRNNVDRLVEDHARAQKLGRALHDNGLYVMRDGIVDTNIVYFGLPESCPISRQEFTQRLWTDYGVKVTGGYSSGGRLFRAVTHLHIDDNMIDRAIEGILNTVAMK